MMEGEVLATSEDSHEGPIWLPHLRERMARDGLIPPTEPHQTSAGPWGT